MNTKQQNEREIPIKWMLTTIFLGVTVGVIGVCTVDEAPVVAEDPKPPSSYAPVVAAEPFETIMRRVSEEKAAVRKRQMDLLAARYDLADTPVKGIAMSRGKAVQGGVRVKLPDGATWDKLATMSPDQIKEADLFTDGFYPLPHPNHPEGGMVFPEFHIKEIKKQTGLVETSPDSTWISTFPTTFWPTFHRQST